MRRGSIVHLTARSVVRSYEEDPAHRAHLESPFTREILDRLMRDSEGHVSAALHRLTGLYAHPKIIVFYLLHSAELSRDRGELATQCSALSKEFRENATRARELFKFAREQVAIDLWRTLPDLANGLEQRAAHYEATLRKLQLSRKNAIHTAPQLSLLRLFTDRLLWYPGLTPADVKHWMTPIRREAIKWLVEAALNCKIEDRTAMETLAPSRLWGLKRSDCSANTHRTVKPLKSHKKLPRMKSV